MYINFLVELIPLGHDSTHWLLNLNLKVEEVSHSEQILISILQYLQLYSILHSSHKIPFCLSPKKLINLLEFISFKIISSNIKIINL